MPEKVPDGTEYKSLSDGDVFVDPLYSDRFVQYRVGSTFDNDAVEMVIHFGQIDEQSEFSVLSSVVFRLSLAGVDQLVARLLSVKGQCVVRETSEGYSDG